jgi:hypothetical protein
MNAPFAPPTPQTISLKGVTYDAPPTISRFMLDSSFVRLVLGPVGSGKTTGMIFELLRRASMQAPGADGLRRTRFAIVRNTLSQMRQTVLRDIETWLGPIIHYKTSENVIFIEAGDIRSEWFMIPLEDPVDQKRLLSMQLTGVMINEFIEIDLGLVDAMLGRLGRYPRMADGGPTWFGLIGDSNFPNQGSPWHLALEVNRPPDWKVFKQPGGLNPAAENLKNLVGGREYYERLARQQSPSWAKRYVHAEYGDDLEGTLVFAGSFNYGFHTTTESIEPIPMAPVIVGQDFGRWPCAVLTQMDRQTNRVLVLEEIIAKDMALERHLNENLIPVMGSSRYLSNPFVIVGDPAGDQRNTLYEMTSFDMLRNRGLIAVPAPTNDIEARLMAVTHLLLQQRAGGPAILIDANRCPTLIQAMRSMYKFKKTRQGTTNATPEKTNPWSDIMDALQYACLAHSGGFQNVLNVHVNRQRGTRTGIKPMIMPVRGWT